MRGLVANAALDDEEFEMRSPILWTAWGQRPRT